MERSPPRFWAEKYARSFLLIAILSLFQFLRVIAIKMEYIFHRGKDHVGCGSSDELRGNNKVGVILWTLERILKISEESRFFVDTALLSPEINKTITNPTLGKDIFWIRRIKLKFFPQVVNI